MHVKQFLLAVVIIAWANVSMEMDIFEEFSG